MFRLYVFTCCLQRIFYNRKKIPFPRFFFAGWKKSHLLEFFCWCKGKNPIFRAHRANAGDAGRSDSPFGDERAEVVGTIDSGEYGLGC